MPRALCLITGASSGLGPEFARLAARDGYELLLVARRLDRLEALARELERDFGVSVRCLCQDLSLPDAVDRLAGDLDNLEVLVNNAGVGSHGHFWDLPPETETAQVRLNVLALHGLTAVALPGMVRRGHGRILNVASTAAFQSGPGMSTYYATKAFVLSFSEGLAHELRGTGVTCTVLCPGPTLTEFGKTAGIEDSLLFRLGAQAADTVAGSGWRAMRAGKVLTVSGFMNKLAVQFLRVSPRFLVRALVARLNRS